MEMKNMRILLWKGWTAVAAESYTPEIIDDKVSFRATKKGGYGTTALQSLLNALQGQKAEGIAESLLPHTRIGIGAYYDDDNNPVIERTFIGGFEDPTFLKTPLSKEHPFWHSLVVGAANGENYLLVAFRPRQEDIVEKWVTRQNEQKEYIKDLLNDELEKLNIPHKVANISVSYGKQESGAYPEVSANFSAIIPPEMRANLPDIIDRLQSAVAQTFLEKRDAIGGASIYITKYIPKTGKLEGRLRTIFLFEEIGALKAKDYLRETKDFIIAIAKNIGAKVDVEATIRAAKERDIPYVFIELTYEKLEEMPQEKPEGTDEISQMEAEETQREAIEEKVLVKLALLKTLVQKKEYLSR